MVERRPIGELLAYPQNPMQHSEAQISQIAASMREFGWTIPCLVDEKGVLIAGHGRLRAAQQLGLTEVPVMTAIGWTEAQKRAYRIADNQLPRLAEWDETMLKVELTDLKFANYPLELIGFEDVQLVTFMAGSPNFKPGTEEEQGRLDQLSPIPVRCPHCGGEFDARANGKV
jgi:ParB family transcriptional regulator, chromosome partitioning protein